MTDHAKYTANHLKIARGFQAAYEALLGNVPPNYRVQDAGHEYEYHLVMGLISFLEWAKEGRE